jgi:threonyl-tRNA synthetase
MNRVADHRRIGRELKIFATEIIHRSIISTMERMVAHLLEVHSGALPPWLAPTQVIVLPASSDATGTSSGRS